VVGLGVLCCSCAVDDGVMLVVMDIVALIEKIRNDASTSINRSISGDEFIDCFVAILHVFIKMINVSCYENNYVLVGHKMLSLRLADNCVFPDISVVLCTAICGRRKSKLGTPWPGTQLFILSDLPVSESESLSVAGPLEIRQLPVTRPSDSDAAEPSVGVPGPAATVTVRVSTVTSGVRVKYRLRH
jgi:hypothetical protein